MKTLTYPKSYLVWDLETSGLKKEDCKILEIGLAIVTDGVVEERKNWILNHGIEISEEITQLTGITKELIEKDGQDPKVVMQQFSNYFLGGFKPTIHLTHNGMRFDIEWLAYHVAKELGWTVGQHSEFIERLWKGALDTAVFVKASKLGAQRQWNESFKDFADRVMGVIAKGVKYNVAICCDELGIDRTKVTQHRALGDVELTNEIYKKLLVNNQ